ncbi:MAG: FAD-linked oxidase C-terminal domain-containing protein [Akkermansia sp.]|nr:FAD-linked oxidase C-terminal domain-containing protein [Akkermansia sp.]
MKNWVEGLRTLLGECVSTEPEVLAAHAGDKWHAASMPDAVVLATETEHVCAAMRYAAAHAIPVTPRGAGVGYVGGCVPVKGGLVISVANMRRIIEVNPADGVAVVEAGVLTADLQAACAELGWFYPPDPASRKESSIGGNIATNAGGPRCLKYGVTRAYVLGLEVVLADGRVLTCGGRTHKNKQGFDLVGLFCGSEGMLGIVTRATLRIIPAPPARAALHAGFPRFALAAAAVQNVLQGGHLPAAMEITDAFTLRAARKHLGPGVLPEDAQGHIIIEIDGQADAVATELQAIAVILRDTGATQVVTAATEQEVEAIWQLRREFSYSLKATGLTKLNEDVVIPRSQLVALVEFCAAMEQETGIPVACFGHSGDGNIHTNIMVLKDAAGQDIREPADALVNRLFDWVMAHGGSITGEHGIGIAKSPWFPQAIGSVAFDVHRAVKAALDPQGLLNPGKMGL